MRRELGRDDQSTANTDNDGNRIRPSRCDFFMKPIGDLSIPDYPKQTIPSVILRIANLTSEAGK